MSNHTTFDAFSLWKNLYDQTENVWRESIEQALEQKSFAEGLGQFQNQYLQYQGVVNGMTEAYLKQLNMPTREEIASVATLIINVEAKVDDLEEQIDDVTIDHKREIETLKRSITKLDKKLDTVIELLSKTNVEPAQSVNPTAQPNKATGDSSVKKS